MKTIPIKRNLLLLSVLLIIVSCNTLRLTKFHSSVDEDELRYDSKFIRIDSNNIATYECEDFVINALKNYTIASISQEYKFLIFTQESTINLHNLSIVDTIYTFSNKKNTIGIYRARHDDFIYIFDVRNSKFKLAGDVQTGMSKATFCRKFRINESIDSKVKLSDTYGNIEYLFYFKRSKLKRIRASLYLD